MAVYNAVENRDQWHRDKQLQSRQEHFKTSVTPVVQVIVMGKAVANMFNWFCFGSKDMHWVEYVL